ncbi:hypothetical protein BGZ63DRAFT_192136 [Mariannaea sp. PMI_226]|nr:hypothetical protein BGZ63DRAFT_192136 [Mariannaea sp. PMI_226]
MRDIRHLFSMCPGGTPDLHRHFFSLLSEEYFFFLFFFLLGGWMGQWTRLGRIAEHLDFPRACLGAVGAAIPRPEKQSLFDIPEFFFLFLKTQLDSCCFESKNVMFKLFFQFVHFLLLSTCLLFSPSFSFLFHIIVCSLYLPCMTRKDKE